MKVSYNYYNPMNSYSYSKKSQDVPTQPAFGSSKTIKLMEEIKTAKILKNINATFKEIAAIYGDLGYDIIFKGGSHAIIQLTETTNLPLVIPHGSKYVHPKDLKRLQYVLNGNINMALNLNRPGQIYPG